MNSRLEFGVQVREGELQVSSQENLKDYFTEFKSKETSKRRNLECEDRNRSSQTAGTSWSMTWLAVAFIIAVINLSLLEESLHAIQGASPSLKHQDASRRHALLQSSSDSVQHLFGNQSFPTATSSSILNDHLKDHSG